MKKHFDSEMKSLIKDIKNNRIDTLSAIDQYINLINNYDTQSMFTIKADFSKFSTNFNKKEIQKGLNQKKHIQNLNRILVLQEFGIFFEKEEINRLLITKKIN